MCVLRVTICSDPHTRYAALPLDVVMSASKMSEQVQALLNALESDEGYNELHQLFKRLDADGNGELTGEEWSAGLAANVDVVSKYFGEAVSSSDGAHLFNQIDGARPCEAIG